MKVIDLFAGEGNWSAAFRDREHEVLTVEIDERFKPDILAAFWTLNQMNFHGGQILYLLRLHVKDFL